MTVANGDAEEYFDLPLDVSYCGALSGREISPENGRLNFAVEGNSGEIWIPAGEKKQYEPVTVSFPEDDKVFKEISGDDIMSRRADSGKSYEDMTVEELQAEILAKLASNGPLTDRMIKEVQENIYRDSLLNWVKSFR